MLKRILSGLMCLCLVLAAALPVRAEEAPQTEEKQLRIATQEQFLAFAEACRLDSYSQGLTVSLEADLDLSGIAFEGVPSFSGTFEGNGHTISGLTLTVDGSVRGCFRYLTSTAVVRDLTVSGSIAPGGSRGQAGGIAGSNAGTVENCSFTGSVSGGDDVGGLVGVNAVSGIIENCLVQGDVCGNHFVGGIAGKNSGVIRSCTNEAQVNATAQQNTVELSDVTVESLLQSESASTATDIGGIAGNSSGVIRDCINQGDVGYRLMGYNVGGIAGTQSGYITGCENRGQILGRKEVGGIVGQMEPASLVEYSQDALQILQGQLETMSGIANQTAANVRTASASLNTQVEALQEQVQDAKDAVGLLLPDREDPSLPDLDSLQAAKNGLSTSLSDMKDTLSGMSATTQSAMGTLSNNLYALQNQINAMSATLGSVSQTLGGSIADVSDADTEADLTGKVASCVNYGAVQADLNAGGIAGAMAVENDLDLTEDLDIVGDSSLNFESEVRAVIVHCDNRAAVAAGKQAAGGIVGWQSLGLVKDCRSTGDVEAGEASYVGGISGLSTGYIRNCSAKCTLTGKRYVGGIAGSAVIATDCRAMTHLSGSEEVGAILGIRAEDISGQEQPISGNYYLNIAQDPGAIDGVSYDGLAQPLEEQAFFALEDLPELFGTVTVTFLAEGEPLRQITVATGGALAASRIPAVPEKPGFEGEWEGLAQADLSHILFDRTFEAVYTGYSATLQSGAVRENGLPVLLVQGQFPADAAVEASESDAAPELEAGETLLESWSLSLPEAGQTEAARLQLPETYDGDTVSVRVRGGDGAWRTVESSVNGSYLVFGLAEGDDTVALVQTPSAPWPLYAAVGAAVAIGLTGLLVWKRKTRKKPLPTAS